jgi:hypothetical protein
MITQTAERIVLYARGDPPGSPLPININPIPIDSATPTDGEIQVMAGDLTNNVPGVHLECVQKTSKLGYMALSWRGI